MIMTDTDTAERPKNPIAIFKQQVESRTRRARGSDKHFALLVAQCMADGGCASYGVFSILDRCFSVFD